MVTGKRRLFYRYKDKGVGTSLMVQWLRLHASNPGGTDLIPGQETKIPHAVKVCGPLQKNNEKTSFLDESHAKGNK